jgi:hypothetical protein
MNYDCILSKPYKFQLMVHHNITSLNMVETQSITKH